MNWFEPTNSRKLREIIEQNSDIILCGHEHVSGGYQKKDIFYDNNCTVIEGGCLDDGSNSNSVFNHVILGSGNLSVHKVELDIKESFYKVTQRAEHIIGLKQKYILSNRFRITKSFRGFLDDVGISFQHPRKENIFLEDVFVYQDLEESIKTETAGKSNNQIVKSDFVSETLIKNSRTVITGGKNYGKTALSKKLFLDFHQQQIIPTYLSGADLNSSHLNETNFLRHISNVFKAQYGDTDFEQFKQLGYNEKSLFIDDFHSANLKYRAKEDFLKIAEKFFGKIIIFADDQFKYDEIFALGTESSRLLTYRNFQIRQLGKRLKDKVISKWVLLGLESELSLNDRIKQQEILLSAIERILESKAIPSLPIYILTLLQTVESAIPTNAISGSHGYMYRFLIEQELIKTFRNSINLDALSKFLSHLAHEVHITNRGSISSDQLAHFIKKYKTDHASTIEFDKIIKKLLEVNVLSSIGTEVKINRSYYLYYFVGKYLADTLGDGSEYAKTTIRKMIDTLYVEDNANIITCTAYHTKNTFLRDYVIEVAKKIFEKIDKFDFSDDVQFLKELQCTIPGHLLEFDNDTSSLDRDRRLDDEDKQIDISEEDSNVTENRNESQMEDTSINFNYAMKTISVLGQLLRAYAGQIDAKEQTQIAEVCFSLSMRSVNFLVRFLSENAKDIAIALVEIINKKEKVDEQMIRNLLYYLTQQITISVIERTANSVGAQDLKSVFRLIVENDGSLPTAFLDFVIKLHYSSITPIKEMKDLKESIGKNRFAEDALKILMVKFMRVQPLTNGERQQIASALGLSPKVFANKVLPTRT